MVQVNYQIQIGTNGRHIQELQNVIDRIQTTTLVTLELGHGQVS